MYCPLRQSNHWNESLEVFVRKKRKATSRKGAILSTGMKTYSCSFSEGHVESDDWGWVIRTLMSNNPKGGDCCCQATAELTRAFFLSHKTHVFVYKGLVQGEFSAMTIATTTKSISHMTVKKKKSRDIKLLGMQSLSGYSFRESCLFHSHSANSSKGKKKKLNQSFRTNIFSGKIIKSMAGFGINIYS